MRKLNLGCGKDYRPGWINADSAFIHCDRTFDFREFPWPLEPGSFSEVDINDVLEHLPDTVGTMREIHRVLAPGGIVRGTVPYWACTYAWRDPTHVRCFDEQSFGYFCNPTPWIECGRFEIVKLTLETYADNWLHKFRNLIPFRRILRYFLLNMYDRVRFELRKV